MSIIVQEMSRGKYYSMSVDITPDFCLPLTNLQ